MAYGMTWDRRMLAARTLLCRAIAEDDTYIYVGGDFLNFDNTANADYIVRWHKANEAWSAMETGADDDVWDILVHPDGNVYAFGDFTDIGTATNARGAAYWDGTNWNGMGSPGADMNVRAAAIGADGKIYIVTATTNMNSDANQDYLARWTGSAWEAVGSGLNSAGFACVASGQYIWIGGGFTSAGGTTVDCLARIDTEDDSFDDPHGGNFSASANVYTIAIDQQGDLYIGGTWTDIDSDTTLKNVCKFNGQSFESMDGGAGSTVWKLRFDPTRNIVHASGAFTDIGAGTDQTGYYAVWNGATFASGDIDLNGTPTVYAFHVSDDGDLYMGYDSAGAGTAAYSGRKQFSYDGSAEAYPTIEIGRSGGTSAKLVQIRNETTNATLYFNYDLRDGEILTLALTPLEGIQVSSNLGINVGEIALQNSDIGAFFLDAGNTAAAVSNQITAFCIQVGGPTISAYLTYKDSYLSQD